MGSTTARVVVRRAAVVVIVPTCLARIRFARARFRVAIVMSQNTIASVSVDLDAVACYWRIHALPGAPPEEARRLILRRCLPRFGELFARAGVKATFFVVGQDLVDDAEGAAL